MDDPTSGSGKSQPDVDGRRNARNMAFGTATYFVSALSLLITTPLLLSMLGQEGMGVVVLVKTFLGFGPVLSLGMGEATTKFISKFRGLESPEKIQNVFQTTLTMYLMLGLASGAALFAAAGPLSTRVFDVSAENLTAAVFAFQVGAVGLLAHLLSEVMNSAIIGYERIDVSASLDAVYRIILLVGQVTVLLCGGGVEEIVLVIVAVVLFGLLSRVIALCLFVAPGFRPKLGLDSQLSRQVLGFGAYSWLGSLFLKLSNSMGPVIVGALVGADGVPIFSIALRVLIQIRNLVQKAGQHMFPYISRISEHEDRGTLVKRYDDATRIILLVSCAAITPVFVCGTPILGWWLDPQTAVEVMTLSRIMAIRYAVLPLGLINFWFLLATNQPRVFMVVNTSNCVLVLSGTIVGAWLYGLEGAAWGQLAILATFIFERFFADWKLFGRCSIVKQFGLILSAGIPLLLGTRFWLGVEATLLHTGIAFLFWAVSGGALALLSFWGVLRLLGEKPALIPG